VRKLAKISLQAWRYSFFDPNDWICLFFSNIQSSIVLYRISVVSHQGQPLLPQAAKDYTNMQIHDRWIQNSHEFSGCSDPADKLLIRNEGITTENNEINVTLW
jgi:hypothetical protein